MSLNAIYGPTYFPRSFERSRWDLVTVSTSGHVVRLADVKRKLRVTHKYTDEMIRQSMEAATDWAESQCNRTLRPVVRYRLSSDGFCWGQQWRRNPLPRPPLASVETVRYYDGTTRTATFSSVNSGTDVVTLTTSPTWLATGLLATYSATSADTGLTDGSTYYLRKVSANTITLHTTLIDAVNNTNKVDLSADGATETLSTGEQLVAATNYRIVTPTDGRGRLEWDEDYTFPTLDNRIDAVKIDFTGGWATRGAIPPQITHAVMHYTAWLVDGTSEDEQAAIRLLNNVEWGMYG